MHIRKLLVRTMAVTATAGLVVGLAASQAAAREGLRLTTVSNPNPALVSGGQVLLRATLPDDRSSVRITENGQDVTSAFHTQPDGSLLGLVTGLRDGRNTVTATTGGEHATLQVVNHSITGPVFSGPQQVPFYCQTTAFGLAPAVMPLCSAPTVVSYVYRNTAGAFAPLADPAGRPADLAAAKVGGRSVPYVVRVETGTIDRAVYQMAALYDGRDPSPFTPNTSWNDRLVYTFGGGCNAGYHQGASTAGVLNDLFLAQGYAVTSSSLNVLDNNCSSIISAEAAMMVKEHFIDTYGPVAHTIGWGGSGGAIQQYDIADAYPGILDGIVPDVTFTDPSTTLDPVVDCRLLDNFFAGAGSSFTAAQRTAVAGFRDYDSCVSWDAAFANRVTATDSCNAAIPVSATWDPVINPNGVRCNADEQLVNQLGRDPRTGFVRSTLDNVGVQYGLAALKAGQISAAQFVALNAGIGGLDYTGKPQTARTAADPRAVRTAYADDLVNSAGLGLRTTPIIDQRVDLDLAGFGNEADNIHTMEWSFAMRQRLLAANGTAANQVIIESGAAMDQSAAVTGYELNAMDRWLTAIDADHSDHGQAAKVIADKPVGLGDGCYLSATQRILAPVTDPATGPCAATYPVASNPRQVAGEPKAMNVLTCSLQPINWADYTVTFTAAEQAQLRSAFPRGVCNYRDPGVGQREPRGTWLSY